MQAKGKPFIIPLRERYLLLVSSKDQTDELRNASIHKLSIRGVMHDASDLDQSKEFGN